MPVNDCVSENQRLDSGFIEALPESPLCVELRREFLNLAATLRRLGNADVSPSDARCAAITRIDDAGRSLAARFFAAQQGSIRLPNSDTGAVLSAGCEFFGAVLDAWHDCVFVCQNRTCGNCSDIRIADVRIRLVRAGAERVIWEGVAGGPAHEHLWCWLGAAFREEIRLQKGKVTTAASSFGCNGATVGRDYLRAVAAHSASMELLSPDLLHCVHRLIDFSLPMLQFQESPFAGATFFVDPGRGQRPCRIATAPGSIGGLWFFSPRVAAAALRELALSIAHGTVPAKLRYGDESSDSLCAGIEHLLRIWSDVPPVRRFQRHLLTGSVSAVRGIAALQRLFSGDSSVPQSGWSLRDASRGGFGAYGCSTGRHSVRVGELVGVRPSDGSAWRLALVRRVWMEANNRELLGLESLSRDPVLVYVDDGRSRSDVLLCDPLFRGEAVRIAAPENRLRANVPIFVTKNQSVQKLKPLNACTMGSGFELRVYQVL